jgi:hypothetical protein
MSRNRIGPMRTLVRVSARFGRLGGSKVDRSAVRKMPPLDNQPEGDEERWEEVSLHGCSTGLFDFVLKFLLRNLVFLDSGAANGVRFPPETPRSRLGDHLCHNFGRVGEVDQVKDDDRQE